MFTTTVRTKLATDYGIRDIPHELLDWFIMKHKARLTTSTVSPEATVAFCIANEWQRGKSGTV